MEDFHYVLRYYFTQTYFVKIYRYPFDYHEEVILIKILRNIVIFLKLFYYQSTCT